MNNVNTDCIFWHHPVPEQPNSRYSQYAQAITNHKPEMLSKVGLSVKDMRNFNYPKDKDSAMYLKRVTHITMLQI